MVIDATAPVAQVVDEVLSRCRQTELSYDRSVRGQT
jgi:hypothetical protein